MLSRASPPDTVMPYERCAELAVDRVLHGQGPVAHDDAGIAVAVGRVARDERAGPALQ